MEEELLSALSPQNPHSHLVALWIAHCSSAFQNTEESAYRQTRLKRPVTDIEKLCGSYETQIVFKCGNFIFNNLKFMLQYTILRKWWK